VKITSVWDRPGSTSRRVSVLASDTVKRVALELGGKSANVILGDADLSQAVGTESRCSRRSAS
jgi:hypothetical protein